MDRSDSPGKVRFYQILDFLFRVDSGKPNDPAWVRVGSGWTYSWLMNEDAPRLPLARALTVEEAIAFEHHREPTSA